MSVCVELHLQERPVLIVGGGKVALRKARQFQKEGAILSIVSPTFLNEFQSIQAEFHVRAYRSMDLEGQFYVYAATDDETMNHLIVKEAKQLQILCGSAVRDPMVSASSMTAVQVENLLCAVSTSGSYPAWNRKLLNMISVHLKTEAEKIGPLKELRSHVRNLSLPDETKQQVLEQLVDLSKEELFFLVRVLNKRNCVLCAFHGVADPGLITALYKDLQYFETQVPSYAFGLVFLSEKVSDKIHRRVSLLEEMLELLTKFSIAPVHIFPMLISQGIYEQKIRNCCRSPQVFPHSTLFSDPLQIDRVIAAYVQLYQKDQLWLLTHNGMCEKTKKSLTQSIACYKDVYLTSYQDMPPLRKDGWVTLIPLVMLLGHHAKKDILSSPSSVYNQLMQAGYHVEKVELALFDHMFIKQLYVEEFKKLPS